MKSVVEMVAVWSAYR